MDDYINNYVHLTRNIVNILNNIHERNTSILNDNLINIRTRENNTNLRNAMNSIINLAELTVIRERNNRITTENNINNETTTENNRTTAENNRTTTENNRNNETTTENNTILNNITEQILLNRRNNEISENNYGFRVNNSFRLRRELNTPETPPSPPISPILPALPPPASTIPTPPPPPPGLPPSQQSQIEFPLLSQSSRNRNTLDPPPGIISNRRMTQLSTNEIIQLIRGRRNNIQHENVIIRPTIRQIRNATNLHIYKDISNINQQITCPISLTPFEDNDMIIEIIYCKHIFKEINIRRHFRTSTRCPLCRFDIRDHDVAMRSLNNDQNLINSESKHNSESKTTETKYSVK